MGNKREQLHVTLTEPQKKWLGKKSNENYSSMAQIVRNLIDKERKKEEESKKATP